jgi:hypothetical protein
MSFHPKTKTRNLIDLLNELAGSSRVNDFTIRNIEREAAAMRNANPPGASVVLGAAACLKGDVEAMHAHHRNAIALGGGAYAHFQYAISLSRVGQLAESMVYAERGHEIDPLDADGIELVIGTALALGLKLRAKEYGARWRKAFPDKPPYVTDEEIDSFRGEVRPVVADVVESLLEKHKGLWSVLAKQ